MVKLQFLAELLFAFLGALWKAALEAIRGTASCVWCRKVRRKKEMVKEIAGGGYYCKPEECSVVRWDQQ